MDTNGKLHSDTHHIVLCNDSFSFLWTRAIRIRHGCLATTDLCKKANNEMRQSYSYFISQPSLAIEALTKRGLQ